MNQLQDVNFLNKKLIIFDLDGTLTESKALIEADMVVMLLKLLEKKKVAIISGGGYPQFQRQLLAAFPHPTDNLKNLFLLPTSGTKLIIWRGNWTEQYSEALSEEEKVKITTAIDSAIKSIKLEKPARIYGQILEDRGSQITFSGLGQSAPVNDKKAWDPTREKRQSIAQYLSKRLPEYDVRIGGTTSIDITKRGMNKSYGIRKLEEYLKLGTDEILFIGDALFFGGNDFPARATGIDCIQVAGPEETKKIIERLVQ